MTSEISRVLDFSAALIYLLLGIRLVDSQLLFSLEGIHPVQLQFLPCPRKLLFRDTCSFARTFSPGQLLPRKPLRKVVSRQRVLLKPDSLLWWQDFGSKESRGLKPLRKSAQPFLTSSDSARSAAVRHPPIRMLPLEQSTLLGHRS